MYASQNSTNNKIQFSKRKKKEEAKLIKQKVLKGILPYMVADSGATLSCGQTGDPFIKMGKQSTKPFHTPFGQVTNAMEEAQVHRNVRDPARWT